MNDAKWNPAQKIIVACLALACVVMLGIGGVLVWKTCETASAMRKMSDLASKQAVTESIMWRVNEKAVLARLQYEHRAAGNVELARRAEELTRELNEQISWYQERLNHYTANRTGDTVMPISDSEWLLWQSKLSKFKADSLPSSIKTARN